MTFEERLAALGVDLSDLPSAYTLNAKRAREISDTACRWFVDEDTPDGIVFINLLSIPLFQYILHLVDIIDRMETRLDNVTGELDYLVKICTDCRDCRSCKSYDICDDEDIYCDKYYSAYEYAGIPEDWSADDA